MFHDEVAERATRGAFDRSCATVTSVNDATSRPTVATLAEWNRAVRRDNAVWLLVGAVALGVAALGWYRPSSDPSNLLRHSGWLALIGAAIVTWGLVCFVADKRIRLMRDAPHSIARLRVVRVMRAGAIHVTSRLELETTAGEILALGVKPSAEAAFVRERAPNAALG